MENEAIYDIDENVIKNILDYIKSQSNFLSNNEKIFQITEGNLEQYVKEAMSAELSDRAYQSALHRIAPINILKKMLDKLSQLYIEPPKRETENLADADLISYYETEMGVNRVLHQANFNFNAYKNADIDFYVEDRQLKVRTLPSHQFLYYSNDPTNPLKITHKIKLMGEFVGDDNNKHQKVWIYSPTSFRSIDERGKDVASDMFENQGINPYGVIPGTYINRSIYLVTPLSDTDTLSMVTLFPRLMTDLNYTQMFTSHSVIYGVDVDAENLQYLPNNFWNLKSDPEGKPSIGVLKPEADIEKGLLLFKSQLGTWLESKNITVQALDGLSTDNVASGVALLIREMDTTQDKKVQEIYFKEAEEKDFWFKLATIHNHLAASNLIDDRRQFSDPEKLKVNVEFSDQKPIEDRITIVETAKLEMNAGFLSRKRAIKRLNPNMDDKEIDLLVEEIDEDSVFMVNEDDDNGMAENKDQDRQGLQAEPKNSDSERSN